MPSSAMGIIDSPRISALSDVPEEVSYSSSGGRSSPHPSSLYIHPSMSGSTSTFKGTASAVGSNSGPSASSSSIAAVASPTRPPVGPRNPSTLRASSGGSVNHSTHPESGATTPTTATGPTNGTLHQKTRSRSPMGSIKDRERDHRTERTPREKDYKEGGKSSKRQHAQPAEKALGATNDPRTRTRVYPYLPLRDTQPTPATLMYWSRAPVYGSMPASGMRAHSVTLIDTIAWIFGGCDERGCWRDIWCFNTETMQWSRPEMYGEIPPPCRAHTATLVDRRLVFFGGGEGPVYRNDVYILDTITRRWQQPKFPKTMRLPPPRRAHTSVFYRNRVYIFGGGNGTQALNDLWTLDVSVSVEKMRWEEIETKGKKPTARGYHTANLVGNVMVIIGGSDGRECFSDIWCLNLDSLVWSQVRLDSVYRRLSHTATQVGSYLFIWGGHDGTQYTSDLLLFNLVALAFETRPIAGKPPAPRGYHATIIADSRVFVLGGFNGNEVFDDVHILDLAGAAYLPQVTSFKIDVD